MKPTYLTVATGVMAYLALSAEPGHGSKGMHSSGHQFHVRGQHRRDRELTRIYGNLVKRDRERERENPNAPTQ